MVLSRIYNRDDYPVFHPHWKHPEKPYWAELAWKPDKAWTEGRIVQRNFPINEFCKQWLDPELPDGESMVGIEGKDSTGGAGRVQGYKAMNPIPLEQHQKEVYDSNYLIKEINKKWDISPQHPGIAVSRHVLDPPVVHPKDLGIDFYDPQFGRLIWRGPRFFDSPLDTNCHHKGLALARYSFCASTFYYLMMHTIEAQMRMSPMQIVTHWATKFIWYPTLLGGLYGSSLCACASIRQKDDVRNGFYSSLLIGAIHGFRTNSKIEAMYTAGLITIGYWMFWDNMTNDAPVGRTRIMENITHGHKIFDFDSPPSVRGLPPPDL